MFRLLIEIDESETKVADYVKLISMLKGVKAVELSLVDLQNKSLSDCPHFPDTIVRLLHSYGITTLCGLLQLTKEELLRIPGFARHRVEQVEGVLREVYGVKLRK